MLDKDPSLRPGAIEVRQLAHSLTVDMSSAYESFELSGAEPRMPKAAARPRRHVALAAERMSDDVVVVDPDALEFGVTEMVPTFRKPRWTPEISYAAPQRDPARPAITPKGVRDQVAGELVTKRR